MLCLHLEVFQRFVELFVFVSLLLLLKSFDLHLLLKKSALNLAHVVISFEHLSQKVVWARNWHF